MKSDTNGLSYFSRLAVIILIIVSGFSLQGYCSSYSLISGQTGDTQLSAHKLELSAGFPSSRRSRSVVLNPAVTSSAALVPGDMITLNLFADTVLTAQVDKVGKNVNGTSIIRARIKEYPLGSLIISTTNNNSLASIQIPETGERYRIQMDTISGVYYLFEENTDQLNELEDGPTPIPPLPAKRETDAVRSLSGKMAASSMDPANLDVMIVYTPAAKQWADTSGGGIDNVIAQAVAKGQLALDNSNTIMTINLVYSGEINYTESGSSNTDLNRLTNSSDGYIDEVHTWRDQSGADIVGLFTYVEDTGGLGWLLNTASGLPEYAFSLVRVQQAGWTYSYIHEMGHNMGCHHRKDQSESPGPGLFSYSAGWHWTGNDSGKYCSVMSYEDGGYSTAPYFSNPSILYQGVATGDAADGDNARTIRETKEVIAAYRLPPAYYTLNLSQSGNGSVSVNGIVRSLPWSGTFAPGTIVTLEAAPDSGGLFSNWSGSLSGSVNPTSILMNGCKNITANFALSLYVDINATGANNGTSWADAYTSLQSAISASVSGNQIMAAAGTYKPTTGTDRTIAFAMKPGVKIYGGFPSGGGTWQQRDPNTYQTILSGDLAGNDIYVSVLANLLTEPTRAENSYHVLDGSDTDANAVLDGFTITGGNANTTEIWPTSNGSGMLNVNSYCIIRRCIFRENSSEHGGVMYNYYSGMQISNCIFFRNASRYDGGVMVNDTSNFTMVNCILASNRASNGGGIYNRSSNPVISNCILWGNTANFGAQINNASGSPNITYSDIQGGWSGTGNISGNPLFAGSSDFHLQSGSPCIDAGSNSAVPTGVTTDLAGNPRFIDDPCTADTGAGTPPIVDMGVFEYIRPQYSITALAGSNGAIEPNGTFLKYSGGSQQFEAIPNTGYTVDKWYLNGNLIQTGGFAYALNNIQADANVFVDFKPTAVLTMSVSPSEAGITAPAVGNSEVAKNEAILISAQSNAGYSFISWSAVPAENAVFGDPNNPSTTVILSDIATVTANFNTQPVADINVMSDTLVLNEANSMALNAASSTDDGLPNPPGALTYHWQKVSGPNTYSILDANAAITDVVFWGFGSYEFSVIVSDGQLQDVESVTIDVVIGVAYVANDGNDSTGTGIIGNPFATIQKGINMVQNNGMVIARKGSYYESIDFNGKNIVVRSDNPDDANVVADTVIDANGLGSVVVFDSGEGPNSVLTGFTITGGSAELGGGIYINEASPIIEKNIITGNSANSEGGGIYCWGGSAAIQYNKISGNYSVFAGGVSLESSFAVLQNNLIINNTADYDSGVICGEGQPRIINNTIAGNTAVYDYDSSGLIISSSLPLIISNNIIAFNNGAAGVFDFGGFDPNYFTHNDVYGHSYGNYLNWLALMIDQTGVNGNISVNPLFADADANDYHLLPESLLIDAGDLSSDWSSEPRPNGGRINMGAYGNTSEAARSLTGDITWNKKVDFKDFAKLVSYWLQNEPAVDIAPLVSGDNIVDIEDMAVLAEHWLDEL